MSTLFTLRRARRRSATRQQHAQALLRREPQTPTPHKQSDGLARFYIYMLLCVVMPLVGVVVCVIVQRTSQCPAPPPPRRAGDGGALC